MSLDVGTLTGRIELEDDLSPALVNMSKKVDGFAGSLDKLGDKATKLGRDLLPMSVALTAVGTASVVMSSTFEASMTRLVSIAGVGSDEIDGVKESILKLSEQSGVGPQMLADAMTKVSSVVSDTGVAMDILTIAAQGTKAGFGDTVGVAGALTTVINSYGAEQITAARAADIMAMAIKEGGAEAKELAPTLANVVPFAAQMGVTFEEVGANLATLTKLGVPTAEAVTQLSSVFTALTKETKQGEEALKGVEMSYDGLRASIREKGLMATLTELQEKFKGNLTGMTDVFGRIEALRNVMGTAGSQGEEYARVLQEIKNSSDSANGSMTDMANAMDKTTVQSFAQLRAQVEVLAIRIGDALAPALQDMMKAAAPVLDWAVDAVKWFTSLPSPIQTTALALAGLAAAAAPLLLAFGSTVTVVGHMITGYKGMVDGVGFAIKQINLLTTAAQTSEAAFIALRAAQAGLIGLGIGAFLAAGMYVWDDFNKKAKEQAGNFELLRDASAKAGVAITDLGLAQKVVGAATAGASGAMLKHKDITVEEMNAWAKGRDMAKGLSGVTTELTGVININTDSLKNNVAVTKLSTEELEAAAEARKKFMKDLEDKGKKLHELELNIFNENQEFAKQAIADYDKQKAAARAYYNDVGIQIMEMTDRNKALLTSTMDLSTMFGPMKTVSMEKSGAYAGQTFGDGMKDTLSKTMSQVPDILAKALTGGGGLSGAFSALGSIAGSGVGEQLGKKLGQSISSIASFAGPMGAAIGALAGPMIEMFTKMLDSTAKGIKQTAEGYGVEVTEAMTEAIKKSMKELDLGQQAATILNADKLFPKVDAQNFSDALRAVRDSFSMVATGQLTVAQGAQVVDSMWTRLAAVGTDSTGRISDGMKELIALNDQYGTQSKAITDFLDKQATAAGNAFTAIVGGTKQVFDALKTNQESWKSLGKEIESMEEKHAKLRGERKLGAEEEKRLAAEIAPLYAERNAMVAESTRLQGLHSDELENLGMIAVGTYGAAVAAGKTHNEALKLIAPGMKDVIFAYEQLGIGIEDAGLKSLMMGSIILDHNPALVEAIGGLSSSFVALDNMGQMNADTFSRMQTAGMTMYSRLQSSAAEHGGAAQDALMPMQDYLHAAQIQAEKLGIPLDANTQMLIDQSKELGIWKEKGKSANDLLLEGINELNRTMKDLVGYVNGVSGGLRNIPPTVNSTVNVHTVYTSETIDGDSPGVNPMAEGGFGTTTKPTLFITSEDGQPEQFAFSGQGKKFGSTSTSSDNGALTGSGDPAALASLERMESALRDLPRAINIAVKDAMVKA